MSGASKILMGGGAVDLPSDDEFDNVSFLSHFDGANNGTNIVYDDSSASNHTISGSTSSGSYGNLSPTQGTFGPFARPEGEWSNYFDGSSNYLEIASSSDFNFGTGDFTWEWFFFGAPSGSYPIFYSQAGANFGVYYNVSDGKIYYENDAISDTDMGTLPLNSWNHIAVSRVSGTSNLYLNGTRTATVSDGQDYATGTARVGNYRTGDGSTYPMKGYISNLRIIKGTGLYSASSITVPTSALTAISGTVLLTCQSNRFKDNSASAHAITVAGTPKVKAFTPILTSEVYNPAVNGASAYFSGVDDAASYAANLNLVASGDSDSDFYFGTGAFTLEGWFYLNGVGHTASNAYILAFGVMMDIRNYQNATLNFSCSLSNTAAASSAVISASTSLTNPQRLNMWNHWAITRSGSNMSIFLNGTRLATVSNASGSFEAPDNNDSGATASNAKIKLGSYNDKGEYESGGYQSDFRIVKGTAVYDPTSSTYTVPTAPLTAITNTKLLLNMADGQALDSAAQHNMTLLSNADTSTTQKKFGTASLALDGTGDAAQLHGVKDFDGPFTIECWARADDTGTAFLWCVGQYTIELGITGSTFRGYTAATSYINFFTGGEFTVDTWHHVALVRDTSNVIKCYLDGTASSTTATSATIFVATSGIFYIGGEWSSATAVATPWDGYIDDFRISRFARYTSNFTPSTEAFPDKGQ